MEEVLTLLGEHSCCFLAEQLFLEQLPLDLQLQLANDDFSNPRALAAKADVFVECEMAILVCFCE